MNLYLFDIDNTLLDVNHIHEEAYNEMYRQVFGIDYALCLPKGQERTTYNIIRCALAEKIPGMDIEKKMNDAIESMVGLYLSKANPLFVYSNVQNVLGKLNERGVVAVFTGGARKVTNVVLKKTGLYNYFQHISTSDDATTRRDIVKHAIEKASLGRKFDKIFVIGDAPEDMDAAKANKAIAVGVLMWRYKKEDLEKAGADIIFDDWEDHDFILEKLK